MLHEIRNKGEGFSVAAWVIFQIFVINVLSALSVIKFTGNEWIYYTINFNFHLALLTLFKDLDKDFYVFMFTLAGCIINCALLFLFWAIDSLYIVSLAIKVFNTVTVLLFCKIVFYPKINI